MRRSGHENGKGLRDFVVTVSADHYQRVRASSPAEAKEKAAKIIETRYGKGHHVRAKKAEEV